jgi:hypothetical protein
MAKLLSILFAACYFTFYWCSSCFSQERTLQQEIKFASYLMNKEWYSDALIVLQQIDTGLMAPADKDTLRYMQGFSFFNQKILDSSAIYLAKVTRHSGQYYKSQFFSSYSSMYQNKYAASKKILSIFQNNDSAIVKEMALFQLAGIALLEKKYKKFDTLSQNFSYQYYFLDAQQKNFISYAEKLKKEKTKSPLMAGILSAIVPGTGRLYAGKPRQALGSLFPLISTGLLAIEAYRKKGINNNPALYLFGSAFTVFYISNILGSVFSVKINKEENEQLMRNKILFDLQIPLRSFFN